MTEKIFIQLSDDTNDDLFDAAERISWYIPEQTARFIARVIIKKEHELAQMPNKEMTAEKEYMWDFLNDILYQSGAAYKYILKPANKEGYQQ